VDDDVTRAINSLILEGRRWRRRCQDTLNKHKSPIKKLGKKKADHARSEVERLSQSVSQLLQALERPGKHR